MIKELLSMLADYGLPLVCSAVLIAFYIIDRNKQSKYIYKMLDKCVSMNNHSSKDDVKYDKLYDTINDIVNDIRIKCQASRTQVYMYHNGGKNLVGIPFQKMSCISESVSPGLITFSSIDQNIHRGLYPSISKEFKKNGFYYILNIKNIMKVDPNLYNSFVNKSISSCYMHSILDSDNNTIGFLQVEYISSSIDINTINSILDSSSLKISGIMEILSENTEGI